MAELKVVKVGFVGLGAMGSPMAGHLAEKLPKGSHLFVFDIMQKLVDELCSKYPDTVTQSKNAKDVTDNSVRCTLQDTSLPLIHTGHNIHNVARRQTCQDCVHGGP